MSVRKEPLLELFAILSTLVANDYVSGDRSLMDFNQLYVSLFAVQY